MGRKIDMKKIENTTKCQVTFSKRRSSLMKKANELSVCCDIDVAIVAFSPSGRVSKFSSHNKIDEVLRRYVNLPAERRLNQICNVQAKMEKLKQLSHIHGDMSKLHYLEKQTENLELQIKKKCLELQILETDLRDYEVSPGQEASLNQLLWCERNLNHSLQRVISRKMELVQLESQSQTQFPTTLNQNPISGEILMQLDPWISPYSAKVRETIFQDLVDQATEPLMNGNPWLLQSSENVSKFNPIQESVPPPVITSEMQPRMMDQSLLNFHDENNVDAILKQSLMMDQPFNFQDQNNVSAFSSSSVLFSDAMHMSTPDLCNIVQDLRFSTTTNPNTTTMGMTQPLYNEMGTGLQSMNSNLMSQFSNIEGKSTTINNPRIHDEDLQDLCTISVDNQLQEVYQPHDPSSVLHHKEDANPLFGEFGEDDCHVWASNQESSSLWEWEDLLRDGDYNFTNLPSA